VGKPAGTPAQQQRTVRAVFLDAGGTLIHLDRAFILECLAGRGLHRTEAQFIAADTAARRSVGAMVAAGGPADDTSRWVAYGATLLSVLDCDGDHADAVRRLVMHRHVEGRLWTHTEHGTLDVLQRLRDGGLALGVVSNADGRVASFLEYAGLRDAVDFVIDSGAVGVEKPDARIFRMACEQAGVAPAEAVHVGDVYEIDVVGARAAGVTPLLIDPDGMHDSADCDRIRAITDLPEWLGL
jgi:HAD superfamily hydrolase (TIGR01509 family)